MRQAGQARAAWRKARSAGPQAAAGERPGGAGNIFAPCVISGSSTRKRALGGKIRAPCILNRPIAPGNGCMGRGCCHPDLEKHTFRADVARKGAFFAHSAKKGCIRRGSCQSGPWGRRNARREMGRDADVGARWARCGQRRAMGAMRTRRAQWVRAAAGRYSGDGARWVRAAARGRDEGAAWRAPWERVTVGQGPVSAGPGSGRAAESKTGERRWRRMGAGCGRWLISGAVGRLL